MLHEKSGLADEWYRNYYSTGENQHTTVQQLIVICRAKCLYRRGGHLAMMFASLD